MRFSRAVALPAAAMLAFSVAACDGETTDTSASSEAPDAATELTVLGAASTRVLNEDLDGLSEDSLTFVNAGSSALVQQLADGAPGDVFISADEKHMDDAVEAGLVRDPQVVATNSMVLVVPKGNPAGIESVHDLENEDVKLVLCDSQVPCGAVSKQLSQANSLELNPVSLEHNVADTLGKVVTGEADAAFVYRTDAAAAGDEVEVIDIPHAEEFPNSLVAGVVITTEHPDDAAALVALLGSDKAASLWEKHGFTPAA
ncbi:molybdate ABC transporter substrate-binding protein [Corynebacterium imitans]|uniref:molybdate ABC transporter substrate-binding protein n=1 Tax=Corynebacterium imitans TaxID=156978 RepID=UPI00254F1C3F|nr:molybdate ABC transporter substrate-binding protein [Corynebacterium imitans]MDK8305965.1 molybdate ABC transporter substrate-binding protein [Corynebacterium imitans]MDK8636930.1 molybdate ABC transporter substrate-binding protein [Corynebacterium imitans]MDK8771992.1 molybdate ABC transporter substrate-binding protein [Corynebacterium imitans]